ncbi:MAG: AAA family ATPase [Acidobacteriota bacterium]|nr:AAA family ATPase [Acidobacteriota bacterium]
MRTKLLRGTEDTTVLLVYPSTVDEYSQALRTLGGCALEAGEPAGSRPVRAAYVVTSAGQRHSWDLPDLAVSGRCAVLDEARALDLLQEAARRPEAAAELFPSRPAGAGSGQLAGASKAPWLDAVRRILTRRGIGVDTAVRGGLDAAGLPADVREAVSKRLAAVIESGADRAETEISRVELMLDLPWSVGQPQRFDRGHVARTLDASHAALDGVKEAVLGFLAACPESRDLLTFEGPCPRPRAGTEPCPALVARPAPAGPRASVLCLAGPGGIGKTSLALAVARALCRTCVAASLDASSLKGAIRGSGVRRPGRIVEGLRDAAVNNPVFILEGVDRVDGDEEHDVDSVLALFDPGRRAGFRDTSLGGVSFDLSGIFWITTAADPGAIPEPIRDRLVVVELPPYTEREKVEIARRHLLTRPFDCPPPAACGALAPDSPPLSPAFAAAAPSQVVPTVVEDLAVSSADDLEALWSRPPAAEDAGGAWRTAASGGRVRFEPDALRRIVREYTSEPGVAQLEARLAEACRRALPGRSSEPVVVTAAGVPGLLGGHGEAHALPPMVRQAIETERKRLRGDSKDENFTPTNTWIEWLENLPWTRRNDAPIDLARTREVLDAAQAGLDDAKDLIIEYLAVRRRNPGGAGAVLCLLGPPGVGKTSLAQAVARALGRAFVKLSCGGLRDESHVRGHGRTWHKAQPGAVLRELRRVGYRDPVFVLDEIDKIGPDPAAVLLEVLDPEQNGTYKDSWTKPLRGRR